MSKLVVFRGDAVENEIALGDTTVRIGRDGRNDIVLDDNGVTRFHAEVRAEAGAYFIIDLKSRNGVWVKGRKLNGKTQLALGVPVTIGAYELALEDDVSTTDFGRLPVDNPPLANSGPTDRPARSKNHAAKHRSPTQSFVTGAKGRALLWSGLVLSTLLLCGITYAVIRYASRTLLPVPPTSPGGTLQGPPPPPPLGSVDLIKKVVADHLTLARNAIDNQAYASALRDHLTPILADLDPGNEDALELKQQADRAIGADKALKPPVLVPPPPDEVAETSGIPKRSDESAADYKIRVVRILTNFREANGSLEKKDYATAISRFQSVERDQKGYQDVESLITETEAAQRDDVRNAIDSGESNERAGRFADAMRWYRRALFYDPSSTSARDKIAPLTERMTKEGLAALAKADVHAKLRERQKAIELYKQAVDSLPSDDPKTREAQEKLGEINAMTPKRVSRRSSALAVAVACCVLCTEHSALAQKKFLFFGDNDVTYKKFKDAAGRFELEYPNKDWGPVPAGGSAIAILSRNDRTATVVIDLAPLSGALVQSEMPIYAEIELERLREQQPNAKDFSSELPDSKVGPASLIRYSRVGTNGPERVMRYSVGVGQELYRLDAVAARASLAKHEPILMHMIMSFKAPASPAGSKN